MRRFLRRRVMAAFAAAFAGATLAGAQTAAPESPSGVAAQTAGSALPTLALGDGEGAWVVSVVTSGGFTGRGTGSFTLSSAGESFCVAVAVCPSRLVADTQQSLSQRIGSIPLGLAIPPPARAQVPRGVCNDCVTTTLTVRRRDQDGERAASYTWDVSTASRIPGDVLRLHAELLALTAGAPPR